jgi:hypothetical protein
MANSLCEKGSKDSPAEPERTSGTGELDVCKLDLRGCQAEADKACAADADCNGTRTCIKEAHCVF